MDARASLLLLGGAALLMGVARSDLRLPGAGGDSVQRVTFWNGFTGPDGRTMLGMIRDFNGAHSDSDITMQRMEWATYYNKLMVACLDGRGPDLFVIHASTLARMERAGFISAVDELYTTDLPRDDFDPVVLDQLTFDGRMLGVPLDIHPQGLYGNAAILRELGSVDGDGRARLPATRDEFIAVAKQGLKDENADGHPDQWGFALSVWRHNFQSLLPQFGGAYFDDAGRCHLDHPGNIEALAFLVSLVREHAVTPPPENMLGWVGFRQQKVAMVFDGVYMLGDLHRLNDLEHLAAPMPRIGPRPGTLADAHVLCIRQGIPMERRRAVIRFIRFLSENSLEWAGAGQVPARRSVRDSEAFRGLPVQYQFSRQIPYLMFPPKTPVLFELQLELDLAVEKAFRGRATPEEALRLASRNVQAYLDRDRRETGERRAP